MTEKIFNKKIYKQRRQDLRNNCTDAESQLWQKLKGTQLGVKFRRQHGIGDYIVDFYCPAKKLVIELDGSQHMENQEYDAIRTNFLNAQGIKVLRFWNNEVMANMEGVLQTILLEV